MRNAFGNYRDVLREVSYSPLMAENLSFLGSKSSAYMLERYRIKTSAGESSIFNLGAVIYVYSILRLTQLTTFIIRIDPTAIFQIDENFAREIMQLFTMGVYQLNMDGSFKLDTSGNKIRVYTTNDIVSLSRAWTGFDRQLRRGNVEGFDNPIDPMRIIPEWRDRFPKSDTTDGYIGDRYPLCTDFPLKPFLRKGARYRLLGSSSLPELMEDPTEFETESAITRVVLSNSSLLRSVICNEDASGNCVFENTVVLSTNYNCTGIECDVDTVRVVQVAANMYYEFVHPPCVTLAFYDNPVRISPSFGADPAMCADPKLSVASEACCSLMGTNTGDANRNSRYSGERVTFSTAESRCVEQSKEVCEYYRVDGNYFENTGYFWTTDSCLLQVKVRRDGTVAIVHQPSSIVDKVMHVNDNNENYFRVFWERRGTYPTVENNCDGVCDVLPEGACLCNTKAIENAVFNSMPSSKAEVMEKLNIGGVDPAMFDSGLYSSINDMDTGIIAHIKNNAFCSETIFEYEDDNGRRFLMKNSHSSVYLRAISGGYTGQSFRNAPQFMSLIPAETNLR